MILRDHCFGARRVGFSRSFMSPDEPRLSQHHYALADAPRGIYVAKLVGCARNTPTTIILTFEADGRLFPLSVRSRYGFAPPYGGPSFAGARQGGRYVLAVRKGRGSLIILEYAMLLDAR